MKPEELMIGDLVTFTIGKTKSINKVTCIDSVKYRLNKSNVFAVNYRYSFDEVYPIPLTEEILLKNDFVYENGVLVSFPQGKEVENKCYIECNTRRNGEIRSMEVLNYDRSFKIDRSEHIYVHELQHALRLCGLSELADNFKIKYL